jgi:hypothetical protein
MTTVSATEALKRLLALINEGARPTNPYRSPEIQQVTNHAGSIKIREVIMAHGKGLARCKGPSIFLAMSSAEGQTTPNSGVYLSVDDLERLTKAFNLKVQPRTDRPEAEGEDGAAQPEGGCGILICG